MDPGPRWPLLPMGSLCALSVMAWRTLQTVSQSRLTLFEPTDDIVLNTVGDGGVSLNQGFCKPISVLG